MSTFKENVKILMILNGYKQDHIAKKIGVNRSQIARWLSDGYNPTLETLAKFAEALHTTPSALIMGDEVDF